MFFKLLIKKQAPCKCRLKCEMWQEVASFDVRINISTFSYSKFSEFEFCPGNLTKHHSPVNILSEIQLCLLSI